MSMADEIESTGKKDKMQQDLSGVVAQQLPPQIALAKVISFMKLELRELTCLTVRATADCH